MPKFSSSSPPFNLLIALATATYDMCTTHQSIWKIIIALFVTKMQKTCHSRMLMPKHKRAPLAANAVAQNSRDTSSICAANSLRKNKPINPPPLTLRPLWLIIFKSSSANVNASAGNTREIADPRIIKRMIFAPNQILIPAIAKKISNNILA